MTLMNRQPAAVRIQCFNIISVTMQHNYLTLQGQEALFCVISFKSPQSLWHYQYLLLWTRHVNLKSEYACKQCLKMFRIELRDQILHTIDCTLHQQCQTSPTCLLVLSALNPSHLVYSLFSALFCHLSSLLYNIRIWNLGSFYIIQNMKMSW